MPLVRRLVALISCVLGASLIIGGTLSYWHAKRKIDVEMTSAIGVGESTARDALALFRPSSNSLADLRRIVTTFDGERHLSASLIGPEERTMLASALVPPGNPAPHWFANLVAGRLKTASIALPQSMQPYTALRIVAEPANEISEAWEDLTLKIILIGGFCAGVIVLVYAALKRALQPLDALADALARVGQGDYDAHVVENGPKELAAIYRQFNRMAEQLAGAQLQNVALNEQLTSVQEEERADIARDLHDEIGPFLFAVDVDATTIPHFLEKTKPDEVVARSASIRQSVAHMQSHLRSILGRLRPAALLDLGLAPAVDNLVTFWQARRPGLRITVTMNEDSFGPKRDEVAYRVIQESLSNAVRHGQPSLIKVSATLGLSELLTIGIDDDGGGMNPPTGARGFGIAGMRERILALGGTLRITSNGAGVSVLAEIPSQTPATIAAESRTGHMRINGP